MTTTAELFHSLHAGPDVLLLANCWDAGSARLLESLGAKAVATTSAGLAWAQGYPDGDALPVDRLIAAVEAITRVIRVPLSVDIEAGYSDDPARVGRTVAELADAGAVGVNLEDGAGSAELLAAKIGRVRSEAEHAGVRMFVNARTDVVLRGLVPEAEHVPASLARARLYRDAGADGFFVPKIVDADAIAAITAGCGMPLNVLAWPKLPAVAKLQSLGVRRVSAGSSIAQAAWGRAREFARTFLENGPSDTMFDGAMLYAEINPLFAPR